MSNIQILIDERDIVRGLGRCARILDHKKWSALSEIFAADLTFNYGTGEDAGIQALGRTIRRYLDVCGPTQHLIGSIMVDFTSESEAVSRAFVQARHQRRDDPIGDVFDANGEYTDRWRRYADGWRIVRRDAVWFLHTGDPRVLAVAPDQLNG